MYQTLVKVFRAVTWLLIVYLTYVFLRNVGITPYMIIDQVHEIAYFFMSSIGV